MADWEPEEGIYQGTVDVYPGKFHIETLDGDIAPTLVCVKCNGSLFYVSLSAWQTAVKCFNCGWEYIVHQG